MPGAETASAAAFLSRSGLRVPLVQAPMAGFQDGRLAAAVGAAGAMGSLPGAALSPARLRAEVALLRAAGRHPVNLNFFCHGGGARDPARERRWLACLAPWFDELGIEVPSTLAATAISSFDEEALALVEEIRPEVVSFHFGLPGARQRQRLQRAGAQLWATATTVAEAVWLEAHGVDAVIAQGVEAGGHRGMFLERDLRTQIGTLALLPRIVAAVHVPVIAAGGIANAARVAQALRLGAVAVQVGTAFLLCPEALTPPLHRAALASGAAAHTALTNLFTGRPARSIVNRLMREQGPLDDRVPPFPIAMGAIAPLRQAAEALGRVDFTPLWAGQCAGACRETPAREVVAGLFAEGSLAG